MNVALLTQLHGPCIPSGQSSPGLIDSAPACDVVCFAFLLHLCLLHAPSVMFSPASCRVDIRSAHRQEGGAHVPCLRFEGERPPRVKDSDSQSGYEVSAGNVHANQTVRRLVRRLIELRLTRAIRQFQDRVRSRIRRRCELRQFVVLRMQYICRRRSRARAAVAIQRFFRSRLCSKPFNSSIPSSCRTV